MIHASPPPPVWATAVTLNTASHPVCSSSPHPRRVEFNYIEQPNADWTMDILDDQGHVLGTVRCDHGKLMLMKPQGER
jgi:hypothetical protein